MARLHTFVPLDTAPVELDIAAAVLHPGRTHAGNVIPTINGAKGAGQQVLAPTGRSEISRIRHVAKVGRSSGYTEGRLSAGLFNDIPLEVPGTGIVYYDGLYEIESHSESEQFAKPGDSGAVIFNIESRAALGLVVGGGLWEDNGGIRMLVYACDLAAGLEAVEGEWL